ncbi:MAG TPA: HXXEE domain-containing protein [Gemmatimonadales bacterium]|nr:HXXEE domain-containing protein [Gemmatimonadales bacterium]
MGSFGWAWLAATIALALHVADEASHDFLAWYNPRALRIRQVLGGLPFPPTFTFWPWLIGLTAAVLLLAAMTFSAFAGEHWLQSVAYFLSVIHVANGLLHLGASVAARRTVPGVLSAPLLLVTGSWLAYAAARLP